MTMVGDCMLEVTKLMINDFGIRKLGYDFMGYRVDRRSCLSFHHLIIPKKDCKTYGLGEGYQYFNGCVLVQETSHDYLHLIQKYDEVTFERITLQIIEEKAKGYLDKKNLMQIKDLLLDFEDRHRNLQSAKGKRLIKKEYVNSRILK